MALDNIKSQIKIITPLSIKEKSGVYLAALADDTLVIYKEYKDDRSTLFQRIQQLKITGIPHILSLGDTDTGTILLEEYIEGEDLSSFCRQKCTPSVSLHLIIQLLKILQELHTQSPPVIHRDIKPENILITPDKRLFLIDFDAAREYSETNCENDTVLLGTKGYAAPEQYGFSQTDMRTDIYSLGIVCRLLIENTSFSSGQKHHMQKVIDKATMFDPDRRYQSVTEMLSDINKINHRCPLIFPLIILICLIVFIISVLLIYHNRDSSPYTNSNEKIAIHTEYIYTDWEILPQDCRLSVIPEDALEEEKKHGAYRNNEEDIFHYYKTDPQALLFYDFHVSDQTIQNVNLEQYNSTGTSITERIRVLNTEHYSIQNGCICLSTDLFDSLNSGRYCLSIVYADGSIRKRPFYVYDTVDTAHTPTPYFEEPIKYYDPAIGNEVLFNVLGTPYAIQSVEADGTLLNKDSYRLTLDNRGILLNAPYSRITLTLTNGQQVTGKIYIIER